MRTVNLPFLNDFKYFKNEFKIRYTLKWLILKHEIIGQKEKMKRETEVKNYKWKRKIISEMQVKLWGTQELLSTTENAISKIEDEKVGEKLIHFKNDQNDFRETSKYRGQGRDQHVHNWKLQMWKRKVENKYVFPYSCILKRTWPFRITAL